MKIFKILSIMSMIFLLCGAVSAYALENSDGSKDALRGQFEQSGAGELFDNLPHKLQDDLAEVGLGDFNEESVLSLSPNDVINSIYKISIEQINGPIKMMALLLAIVFLHAMVSGMGETVDVKETSTVFSTICALAACAVIVAPLIETIKNVTSSASSTSVFMISFVPVYSAIMAANGQIASAVSYQAVVFFVCELITLITTYFIVPIMTVSMTLGIAGSMTPDYKLNKVSDTINSASTWFVSLSSTLFVGLLSLQGIVANASDSLSVRAIRFSLSSFVPIVGGALSESLTAVQGSLSVLKSTVGVFGIIVIVLIIIPPLIQCILWRMCLSICGSAAEMFEQNILVTMFKTVSGVLKVLVAILASLGLFMIIATTIMTKATG